MYGSVRGLLQVLWAHLLCGWVLGSELTFELPDNAKQCFHEDIIMGTKCTLEFQVRCFSIITLRRTFDWKNLNDF